jgi:hypothetical protein
MRSGALHVPLCGAQFVEGFDCNEGTTYENAADAKIIRGRRGVLRGTCWIAFPLHCIPAANDLIERPRSTHCW